MSFIEDGIFLIIIIFLIALICFVRFQQNEGKKQIVEKSLDLGKNSLPVLIIFCDIQTDKKDIINSSLVSNSKDIILVYSGPEWKMNLFKRELPNIKVSIVDRNKEISNSLGLRMYPSFARITKRKKINTGML